MGATRLTIIVVGLLVGLGSAAVQVLPKPAVVVPDSKPDASSILSGVSAADRRQFLDFYAAMGDIVLRDGASVDPVCKSVFDLRNRHRHALWLAFGATNMVGKYTGLGDRLDAHLLAAIGDTDVALTPDLRKAASKAFSAIK